MWFGLQSEQELLPVLNGIWCELKLPRVMKHYSRTGRRNHGRPLKRLLDTWDRNGSTSGPTPWHIYDDDDDDDDGVNLQALKAVTMNTAVFCDVIPRSLAYMCLRFRGTPLPLPKSTGSKMILVINQILLL